MRAVDPDVAVGHNAVEVDEDEPAFVICRQREMFAIPADAGGKKTARAAGWVVLVEWSLDTPIVRHVQLTPGLIIKLRMLSSSRVAFEKEPIGIKRGNDASRSRRTRADAGAAHRSA